MAVRNNYLNNRDMLAEIHKSKSSYCSFIEKEYHQYDIILQSLEITNEIIEQAKQNKAKRLTEENYKAKKLIDKKIKLAECEISPESITTEELIFRVMTYEHIPINLNRKKNPKTEADRREKVNFPPFQHWKFNEDGKLICVGKSHWVGGMENGHFDKTHGKITNELAKMMMKLCERIAKSERVGKISVKYYSYNDEMQNQAILQLIQTGLQFNESKSENPFAYFTTITSNAFIRVINLEKRNQEIRDDILELNDMAPSYTRSESGFFEEGLRRYNSDDGFGPNNE